MTNIINEHRILGGVRGQLIAIESGINIPFEIKRVFYIYGNRSNLPRGEHSHHKTKQYLIVVNGSCKVTLDNGESKETYELNQPNIGLFQDAMVWGTMHDFSANCILLVLADQHYNEADYIRSYAEFIQLLKQ